MTGRAAQGVNVVTMSWHFGSEESSGALHSRDVYFDYWVTRYPYPSVFASAGNEAGSDAFASGKGYNFLGVGNVVNDGDGDRCNDVISGDSSRKNPTSPHSDHEVPGNRGPGQPSRPARLELRRHELRDAGHRGDQRAVDEREHAA